MNQHHTLKNLTSFSAIESAYNIIFSVNIHRNTVTCIYGDKTSDIGDLFSAEMTIPGAITFWVNNYIVPEDRAKVTQWFMKIPDHDFSVPKSEPLQEEFRVMWTDNVVYTFICVAFKSDDNHILICCRDTEKVQVSGMKAREIRSLKKLHTYFDKVSTSNSNVLASVILEINESNMCNLIYASQTIFSMMNWRYDQYLHYIEDSISFDRILAQVEKLGVTSPMRLFDGDIITTHIPGYDSEVVLSCSEHIPGIYSIVARTDQPTNASIVKNSGIFVRTFGFFDIFVDGVAVSFSSQKEKELLALLIDRKGGIITSSSAITALWEDEVETDRLKAKFRKLIFGLKNTLSKHNIADILISNNGSHCIDTSLIICDYYELLNGNPAYKNAFHNSYMADYSWGEYTLATLWNFE